MDTNKICELLENKAINEEKKRLEIAASTYNKTIGLGGTCEMVLLADKEGREIRMYTSDIYQAITAELLKKRDKRLKSDVVSQFLKQVEDFQLNIESLAEYCANQ